jgi:hypothetical protein
MESQGADLLREQWRIRRSGFEIQHLTIETQASADRKVAAVDLISSSLS